MEVPTMDIPVLIPDEEELSRKDVRYLIKAIKALGSEATIEKINAFIETTKRKELEQIPQCFEEHRQLVLQLKKDQIEEMLERVVPPFKPFISVCVTCILNEFVLVLDEEKYIEAAKRGEVPTMVDKEDALKYLEERKNSNISDKQFCLFD